MLVSEAFNPVWAGKKEAGDRQEIVRDEWRDSKEMDSIILLCL